METLRLVAFSIFFVASMLIGCMFYATLQRNIHRQMVVQSANP